mgnify:CR=1 FL=1
MTLFEGVCIGFLGGVITTLIIIGATAHGKDKYVDIDVRGFSDGGRNRSRNDRHDREVAAEKEIREHAKRLGVKIGE